MQLLDKVNPGTFKRYYVITMMQVVGRALEAASQVDERVQHEISSLQDGFLFQMKVIHSFQLILYLSKAILLHLLVILIMMDFLIYF